MSWYVLFLTKKNVFCKVKFGNVICVVYVSNLPKD